MTTMYQESMKKFGTYKEIQITKTNPTEDLQATPVDLPIAEPTTGQITFTLTSAMLPTFSAQPYSYQIFPQAILAGKNTTASSITLNYRVLKNGSSIYNGSAGSCAANQFWTVSLQKFNSSQVGDTFEIRLWGSATGLNFDYKYLTTVPSRLFPEKPGTLYKDISISYNYSPVFTAPILGTPVVYSSTNGVIYFDDNIAWNAGVNNANIYTVPYLRLANVSGCGRIYGGDQTTAANITNHASNRPYYYSQALPVLIKYRIVDV